MGPSLPELCAILFAMGTPAFLVFYFAKRWFQLKEKRLEIDALLAAEKAAQYVSHSKDVEARLAVVERIVTDRGAETAAQIEALRPKALSQTAVNG
jgi:hypothetical protein